MTDPKPPRRPNGRPRGSKQSPEVIERIRQSKLGTKARPSTRLLMSLAKRRAWIDPVSRANMMAGIRRGRATGDSPGRD